MKELIWIVMMFGCIWLFTLLTLAGLIWRYKFHITAIVLAIWGGYKLLQKQKKRENTKIQF